MTCPGLYRLWGKAYQKTMENLLRRPPFLKGIAIALLALACLLSLHHQAEHFGKAGECPLCMQGPVGVVGLPSATVSLMLRVDSECWTAAFSAERRLECFLLPSTSRAPPPSTV